MPRYLAYYNNSYSMLSSGRTALIFDLFHDAEASARIIIFAIGQHFY